MTHDEAPTGLRDQATETAEAALELGAPAERISMIAAVPGPPGGVRSAGAIDAGPYALERTTGAILASKRPPAPPRGKTTRELLEMISGTR